MTQELTQKLLKVENEVRDVVSLLRDSYAGYPSTESQFEYVEGLNKRLQRALDDRRGLKVLVEEEESREMQCDLTTKSCTTTGLALAAKVAALGKNVGSNSK